MHEKGIAMLMKKQLTRRGFVAGSAIGAVTLAGYAANQEPQGADEQKKSAGSLRLAIVHTNDTHGYDNLTDENMGMAVVAQLARNMLVRRVASR